MCSPGGCIDPQLKYMSEKNNSPRLPMDTSDEGLIFMYSLILGNGEKNYDDNTPSSLQTILLLN